MLPQHEACKDLRQSVPVLKTLQRDLGVTEKENNANRNNKIMVNCKGINKSNED